MSVLSAFPEGLPWGESQAFVLLDGATISDLPQRLKQLNPTASTLALYDQPPFSALRDVSPLLVAIEQPDDSLAQFYLHSAQEEWGVLLFSAAPLHGVAEHLRKLITVELPAGQSAFLRMADAAVAQALFASADQSLFGPLTCVVTADVVNDLWRFQRPRQTQHPELTVPYRLSPEQDIALDQVDRRRTLLELDAHLLRYFSERHSGESLAQRWGVLDQLETQASALGLGGPSALFYYANVVFWLGSSEFEQHPQIHHLLHTPTLQSPGERVALAAALAHQWAAERGRS